MNSHMISCSSFIAYKFETRTKNDTINDICFMMDRSVENVTIDVFVKDHAK